MNTAVYYPHFHPTEGWLRRAALLWNEVHLMDPRSSGIGHPPEIEALDEALGGVLRRTDPWKDRRFQFTEEVVDRLGHWLDQRPTGDVTATDGDHDEATRSFAELEAILPRAKLPEGPVVELLAERGVLRSEPRTTDVVMADWEVDAFHRRHMESIFRETPPEPGSDHERHDALRDEARELRWNGEGDADRQRVGQLEAAAQEIRSRHLVTLQDHSIDYLLPTGVAKEYLAICAEAKATAEGRDLVTDGTAWTEPIVSSVPGLRGAVSRATLETFLPEDIDRIDAATLAAFRTESASKRLTWQAEIQQLVDSLSAAASVDTYGRIQDQLVELANERIEDTKRQYRDAKLRTATEALSISLTPPALATFAASALGIGLIGPVGLSAALSLVGAQKFLDWRAARADYRSSPWSYVLDVAALD